MKEQLIEFETAKLAKDRGFEIQCLYFYTKSNSKMFGIDEKSRSYPIKNIPKKLYECGREAALNIESVYLAPTQSLLQKWLREVHSINIIINYDFSYSLEKEYYSFRVRKLDSDSIIMEILGKNFDTYEQTLEAALKESLKLIKDESTGN